MRVAFETKSGILQFTFNYEGIRNVTALTLGVATLPYTVYKTVKACTAGIAFFGFTHTFLDIVYIAAMLAVAILSRPGASGCYQYLQSVLEGSWTGLLPCTAMSASFAMAILAALMLVFAIIFQLLIRAREKPWAHTSKGASDL